MDKILIVDDQQDIRKLLRLTFGRRFSVLEAEDAASAWETIRHEQPRVVLLDVMMPGEMDGYQLCERIRKDPQMRRTYVALLTARGQAADVERGESAGADDYFIKPFSPLQLVKAIESRLTAN